MDLILKTYIKVANIKQNEKGSISLEYILFIVAIAAASAGIIAFYTNIGTWFQNFALPSQPSL